jgi:hypothetical protein
MTARTREEHDAAAYLARHMDRLPSPLTAVAFRPGTALSIVAQLQLAARHPGNVGIAAEHGRALIEALIYELADGDAHAEALLRRGDDPAHDVASAPPDPPCTILRVAGVNLVIDGDYDATAPQVRALVDEIVQRIAASHSPHLPQED